MTAEDAIAQINEGREVTFGGVIACRQGLKILSDMSDLFEPIEAEKRREFRLGKIVFTLSRGVKPAPIPTILWEDILEAKVSAGDFRPQPLSRDKYASGSPLFVADIAALGDTQVGGAWQSFVV